LQAAARGVPDQPGHVTAPDLFALQLGAPGQAALQRQEQRHRHLRDGRAVGAARAGHRDPGAREGRGRNFTDPGAGELCPAESRHPGGIDGLIPEIEDVGLRERRGVEAVEHAHPG
jgi:hypothetical protein